MALVLWPEEAVFKGEFPSISTCSCIAYAALDLLVPDNVAFFSTLSGFLAILIGAWLGYISMHTIS